MRGRERAFWTVIAAVAALGAAAALAACRPAPAASLVPPTPTCESATCENGVCENYLDLGSRVHIRSLVEGPTGTLWVATDGAGVIRYDGTVWCYYTKLHGLLDDRVDALAVDDQGAVWTGTVKGLAALHPDDPCWRSHRDLTDQEVRALFLEGDTLWVGTLLRGVTRWQDGNQLQQYDEDWLHFCQTLAWDGNEDWLWVGTVGKGLCALTVDGRLPLTITRKNGLPSNGVRALWLTDDGVLWVGTEGGLARVERGRVTGVYTAPHGLPSREKVPPLVTTLVGDGAGGLWLGTHRGQVNFEPESGCEDITDSSSGSSDWSLVHFDPVSGCVDRKLFGEFDVEALLLTRDGTLWIGGEGHVVPHPLPWTSVGLKETTALAGLDGQLWVGTADGKVRVGSEYAQDARGFEPLVCHVSTQEAIAGPIYALLPQSADEVWVGTKQGAVQIVSGCIASDLIRLPQDDRPGVQALAGDSEGGLWLGGPGGLVRLDGAGGERVYTKADGLASTTVYALWADEKERGGRVWVGTYRGLFVADPPWDALHPVTITKSLEETTVRALYRTGDVLWVGTDGGIGRFNEECASEVQPVRGVGTNREVLAIGGIGADDRRVWFRTDEGLLVLDDNDTCVSEDDVAAVWEKEPGDNYAEEALWPVDADRVWMTTREGLAYHRLSPHAPAVQAWRQVAGEDSFSSFEEPLNHRQTNVTVHLCGGDLGDNTPGVTYRYQRQPDDSPESWHSTIENHLSYTLTAGSVYTFSVVAFDGDLNPSPLKSLEFEVKAVPLAEWLFGQTWFRVLLVVLAVAAILWIVAQIIQYLRLKKYADFVLEVARAGTDQLQVTVRVGGRRVLDEATFPLPWEKTTRLARQIAAEPYGQSLLKDLGQQLGAGLLSPALRSELGDDRLARLRLDFAADDDDKELAGLPWELAFDPQGLGFLGQRADTALVRYVKPDKKWKRPRIRKTLRVLVVMAQPREVELLDLVQEKARLDEILTAIEGVEIAYLYGVHAAELVEKRAKTRDLPRQLAKRLAEGWDVLHFVGHAGRDRLAETSEGAEVVLWCEDRRGNYLALGPDELGTMLDGLAGEGKLPKLVVLNACKTANIESKLVQTILDSGVGAVVGMQWPVLDVAARTFVDGFYGTLVDNGQVDYAVSVARNRISSKVGTGRGDWAAPVLVMRTFDGIIFKRTWYDILLSIIRRR